MLDPSSPPRPSAAALTSSSPTLELVVLGTGAGHSHVYDGRPNAGYALVVDARPVLLIGAGGGAVHQCRRLLGSLPASVFVHSNRTAAAAELPVLLSYEAAQGRKMSVIGGVGVIQRLAAHRLAEVHDVMRAKGQTFDDLCSLEPLDEGQPGFPLPDCPDVSLAVRAAPQSELSYALLVLHRGQPLLAVSGDAGIGGGGGEHLRFYGDLSYAPTVVLDGRPVGTPDHAPAASILDAYRTTLAPNARARGQQRLQVLIGGHDVVAADQRGLDRALGIPDQEKEDTDDDFGVAGAREGAVVSLVPMADSGSPVRSAGSNRRGADTPPQEEEAGFESPTQRRVRVALGDMAVGRATNTQSAAAAATAHHDRHEAPRQQQQQHDDDDAVKPQPSGVVDASRRGPLSPGTYASRQWQQQHAFDDDDDDGGTGEVVGTAGYAARPAAPRHHTDPARRPGGLGARHGGDDDDASAAVHDFGVAASGRGPGNSWRPNSRAAAQPAASNPVAFGSSSQRPTAEQHRSSPARRTRSPAASSSSATTTARRTRSPAAPTMAIPAAKKLWLFSCENRHEPPVPVMVQHLRTLKQLHDKAASAVDGVKPVEGIYTLHGGSKVTRLDQVQHMDAVVVCKLGGERWTGLPPGGRGLPDTMREWLRDHGASDVIQVAAVPSSSRHASPAAAASFGNNLRAASVASSMDPGTRLSAGGQARAGQSKMAAPAPAVGPVHRRRLL